MIVRARGRIKEVQNTALELDIAINGLVWVERFFIVGKTDTAVSANDPGVVLVVVVMMLPVRRWLAINGEPKFVMALWAIVGAGKRDGLSEDFPDGVMGCEFRIVWNNSDKLQFYTKST